MAYKRERVLPESFIGEKSGRNKIDFIIDNKILLEIKAKKFFEKTDYFQAMRYLTSFNKRLCIVVNFHQKHLTPKRILNGFD